MPYLVHDSVTVASLRTVSIDPGVIVKFNSGRYLRVDGALVTAGTDERPVVFTSYRDERFGGDTNADGPSSGSPGDWYDLRFYASGSLVDGALVLYAGQNGGRAVDVRNGSSPVIS